jgi:hypothetical protein
MTELDIQEKNAPGKNSNSINALDTPTDKRSGSGRRKDFDRRSKVDRRRSNDRRRGKNS